jgi:hypothetical protein
LSRENRAITALPSCGSRFAGEPSEISAMKSIMSGVTRRAGIRTHCSTATDASSDKKEENPMSHNNISTVIYVLNKKITVTKKANPDLVKKIMVGIARAQK